MIKNTFYNFISYFIPGMILVILGHYFFQLLFMEFNNPMISFVIFSGASILFGLIIHTISNWLSSFYWYQFLMMPKLNLTVTNNNEISTLINEINQIKNSNLSPEELVEEAHNELEYINKVEDVNRHNDLFNLAMNTFTVVLILIVFTFVFFIANSSNFQGIINFILLYFIIIILLIKMVKFNRINMLTKLLKTYLIKLKHDSNT